MQSMDTSRRWRALSSMVYGEKGVGFRDEGEKGDASRSLQLSAQYSMLIPFKFQDDYSTCKMIDDR
jgi:hypothetical protein